eukprot:142241_1
MALILTIQLLISILCTATFIPKKYSNGNHLTLSDLGPARHHDIIHSHFFHTTTFKANTSAPIIYPTDFGADPTGATDSTSALQKAINMALSYGAKNVSLSNEIHDCGGATIDLAGGDYMISAPLMVPQFYGNLRFIDGTIRASTSFKPTTSYLLIIGDDTNSQCSNSQKSCNENIAVENMMFDGRQTAFGCIHVINTMGFVAGPQLFFLGFNGAGITATGGHETMIFKSWFGEFLYSDSRKENGAASTATAVQLFGNDHYMTDCIVFSSKIGVHIKNPANILKGVHTWNLATGNNGTGIKVESIQTRILNCYLDWNDLVIVAPIQEVSVEDSFFLEGCVHLEPVTNSGSNIINGLSIFDNQYASWQGAKEYIIQLDTTYGKFQSVKNMFVGNNMLENGYKQNGVKASKSLKLTQATEWTFDFTAELIFDCNTIPIQWVDYTIQIDAKGSTPQFVQHVATTPVGCKVSIFTSAKCDATVYVTVYQTQNFDY